MLFFTCYTRSVTARLPQTGQPTRQRLFSLPIRLIGGTVRMSQPRLVSRFYPSIARWGLASLWLLLVSSMAHGLPNAFDTPTGTDSATSTIHLNTSGLVKNSVSSVYASDSTVCAVPDAGLSVHRFIPTITVGTATEVAKGCVGTTSSAQSFTVAGSGLTADLVVTAPAGFEISDWINYTSSLTLTQSNGLVSSTTLYVRATPATTTGTKSGNVTLTSAGATSQTVAVSATVVETSPDYQPLVDFYNATNGANWNLNTGWLQGCDPCTGNNGQPWYGVTCADGRVKSLWFRENQLSGSLPSSLSALSRIEEIGLSMNRLYGSIPESFSTLTNLKELDLSDNSFSGSIPESFSALTSLQSLGLSYNVLSGSIPASLSALTNLKELWLGANRLSGSIPASLSALTNLRYLNLGRNQLTGSIPASLSALSNLNYLNLSNNQLSGSIPASLSALTNLADIDLSSNQLLGSIHLVYQH